MLKHTPSTGSLSTLSIGGATFDLFMTADESLMHTCKDGVSFALPLGSKKQVHNVLGTFGGGANNTAVGFARLGCDASLSTIVGTDQWGEAIIANLTKEGVCQDCVTVIEHEQTSFSLILNAPSGERSILSHKHMDRHLHDVTFDKELVSTVDGVYLNHIHEDSCVIEDDIIESLQKKPSAFLSWNPGGTQIKAGIEHAGTKQLLACTNLLLLNKEEALAMAKEATVPNAIQTLLGTGVQIVCITDGRNGAIASTGKETFSCNTLPCPVVDTTGAGDSFGCAMTWALLSGKDLPTALKAGTINAMSVVGQIGAETGLLTQKEMESKLTDTPLTVSVSSL